MKNLARLIFSVVAAVFLASAAHGQQFKNSFRIGDQYENYNPGTIAGINGTYYVSGYTNQDSLLGIDGSQLGTCSFVAKFDSAGTLLWALKSYNNYARPVRAMAIDSDGNLYITGETGQGNTSVAADGKIPVNLDNSTSYTALYVMKFDPDGNGLWGKLFLCTGAIFPTGITAGPHNKVFVTGNFTRKATFGSTSINTFDYSDTDGNHLLDIFLVGLSAENGTMEWAKQAGSLKRHDYAGNIGSDAQGNVYVTGSIETEAVFGTIAFGTFHGRNMLLAKCNPAGDIVWAKSIGGNNTVSPQNMVTDASGNCYITGGTMYGPVNICGITFTPGGPYSGGVFLARITSSGHAEWVKNRLLFDRGLTIDNDQNIYCIGQLHSGYYNQHPDFPGFDHEVLGNSDVCVIKYNAYGTPQWVRAAGGTSMEDGTALCATDNGNIIATGTFRDTTVIDGHLLISKGATDIFVTTLTEGPPTAVTGTVFLDANENGVRDLTETPAKSIVLSLANNAGYGVSNTSGNYLIYTRPGTHQIQIPVLPRHHKLTSTPGTATVAGFGQTDTLAPIGIAPIPGIKEVEATLTIVAGLRPGFDVEFLLTYRNTGTAPVSSSVKFVYDQALVYNSSNPLYSAANNNELDWEFTNLVPGEQRDIRIYFTLPDTIPISTILYSDVYVAHQLGYENPLYEHYQYEHLVTGSFDPNDKQVTPSGSVSPDFISRQKPLEYTIRFQNTGTDTAFTVLIRDYLSEKLVPGSIRTLSASHPFNFNIRENGIAEWKFENILLPDSGVDNSGSNGFVKFQILPLPNLQISDTIANTAFIYFDFNEAIVTNTTKTVVKQPARQSASDPFTVYPNPNAGSFFIAADLADEAMVNLMCYNAAGQLVLKTNQPFHPGRNRHKITLGNLPEGLYFLQMQLRNQLYTRKLFINSE